MYYDVWDLIFAGEALETAQKVDRAPAGAKRARDGRVTIGRYTITTEVQPPKRIQARARVQCEIKEGGARAVLFELSRYLQIESVKLDAGQAVEFIQNPAVEGTQLSAARQRSGCGDAARAGASGAENRS